MEQSVPISKAPKGSPNSDVWYRLRVVLGIRPDGSYRVRSVTNWENICMRPTHRNRPKPISEASILETTAAFMATPGNGLNTTIQNTWCFHFAMHIDGTPWIDELKVRQVVIATAQATVTGKA